MLFSIALHWPEIVITKSGIHKDSQILSNRSLANINMAQMYNLVLTIPSPGCVKKRKLLSPKQQSLKYPELINYLSFHPCSKWFVKAGYVATSLRETIFDPLTVLSNLEIERN